VTVGCTAVDSFDGRVASIADSYTEARNTSLLANIARARHEHPLAFVAITGINDGTTMGGLMGLPTFTFGPGQVAAQKQFVFGNNSLNGSLSNSFAVAPLDSKEFVEGVMAPVSLASVQVLIRQGYPREVLYYLLVDSIVVNAADRPTRIANDPLDPTFPEFERFIHQAMIYGMTIEASPKSGAARLCFDRTLSARPIRRLKPVCGSTDPDDVSGFVDPTFGRASLTITLRSTWGVFRYLGRLVEPEINQRVRVTSDEATVHGRLTDTRLFPLTDDGSCLVAVTYLGDRLCVPNTGATNGARVLDILGQLLALRSSVRNLPSLQTIRVVN
jgi:hypothetical protein